MLDIAVTFFYHPIYMIIGWHKSIVSSDWSDTMLDIAVTFFYHPIYMILVQIYLDSVWEGERRLEEVS